MAAECIFCRIASGDAEARVAYETDDLIAFHDANAQAPIHILIIPRKHIPRLDAADDADAPLLGALLLAARNIAAQENLSAFRLVANNGAGAGQSVDHLHFHLLAGRNFSWPPG